MKISTRTRYGVRLMVSLGVHYGRGPVFLKDIARLEEISEKYLSQIIIPLKTAGLVNSFRGARGGYVLAHDPKDIKLSRVVEVLEGGLDLVYCLDAPGRCSRVPGCAVRSLWRQVGDNVRRSLDGVTLEDLVRRRRDKEHSVVMYNI